MAAMVALDEIHPLTPAEYLRLVEDPRWEKTELVRGVVYDVTPQYDLHAGTVFDLGRRIADAFPAEITRLGITVLGASSVFEPDVCVIDGAAELDPMTPVPGHPPTPHPVDGHVGYGVAPDRRAPEPLRI